MLGQPKTRDENATGRHDGMTRHLPLRPDWELVKEEVMLRAVRGKFQTHPALRNLLLSTMDQMIVENAPMDAYWGVWPRRPGTEQAWQDSDVGQRRTSRGKPKLIASFSNWPRPSPRSRDTVSALLPVAPKATGQALASVVPAERVQRHPGLCGRGKAVPFLFRPTKISPD